MFCKGGGGSGGLCPPGAKAFLLVTDNRRSRLDSPFCVITQQRKFEFGHHRQSKKVSNAQELAMQLSQTLFSASEMVETVSRRRVDLCCLQETRWKMEGVK